MAYTSECHIKPNTQRYYILYETYISGIVVTNSLPGGQFGIVVTDTLPDKSIYSL